MCIQATTLGKIQVKEVAGKNGKNKLAVFVKDQYGDGQNGGDNSEYTKVASFAGLVSILRKNAAKNLKLGRGDKALNEALLKLPMHSK